MTGEKAKTHTDPMRGYLSVRLLEMLELRDRNIQDGAEDDKLVWLNESA